MKLSWYTPGAERHMKRRKWVSTCTHAGCSHETHDSGYFLVGWIAGTEIRRLRSLGPGYPGAVLVRTPDGAEYVAWAEPEHGRWPRLIQQSHSLTISGYRRLKLEWLEAQRD